MTMMGQAYDKLANEYREFQFRVLSALSRETQLGLAAYQLRLELYRAFDLQSPDIDKGEDNYSGQSILSEVEPITVRQFIKSEEDGL